jgi:hypothetical protein
VCSNWIAICDPTIGRPAHLGTWAVSRLILLASLRAPSLFRHDNLHCIARVRGAVDHYQAWVVLRVEDAPQ